MAAINAAYGRLRRAAHELAKFGTLGRVVLVVNAIVTNLCWQAIPHKPVIGSVVGTVIAAIVAYWAPVLDLQGPRLDRPQPRTGAVLRGQPHRDAARTIPLAFSQYVLHFDGALANNVAKYVFGLPLGMVFRLWTYRTWIFPKMDPALAEAEFQYPAAEPLPTSQLPTATSGPRHKRTGAGSSADLLRASGTSR